MRWLPREAVETLALGIAIATIVLLLSCSSECLTDCGLRSDTADCAALQRSCAALLVAEAASATVPWGPATGCISDPRSACEQMQMCIDWTQPQTIRVPVTAAGVEVTP